MQIGRNTHNDITPTGDGWNAQAWNYANFGSYGGPVFVPGFSPGGAIVFAGTGGHNHPDNHGAAAFDFSDATWKRLDNANGVPRKSSAPFAYRESESNGSPFYEVVGSQVPLPPHPYNTNAYLPEGSRGSVVFVTRAALGVGASSSGAVHKLDLATRVWTRYTNAVSSRSSVGGNGGVEGDVVYDAARNRYWHIPLASHNFTSTEYFDVSTKTFKTTVSHPYPPSSFAEVGRVWMHDGILMRQVGSGSGGRLWYFDPDNASAGWNQCSVSGSLPDPSNMFVRRGNGGYYWYHGRGGNTLNKLVPPANPRTGTWVASTVQVSGATLPAHWANGTTFHYKCLFDVPAIACLAWVPGGSNGVYLIRPE